MVPDSYSSILSWEAKSFAHVATIGRSGEPRSTPVWFDWDGTQMRLTILEHSQKLKNLRRDQRVSLSILDPHDPYRYVEIRGVAESFQPDADLEFTNRMARKYLELDEYPWHEEGHVEVVVAIRPTSISGSD